jgi:thiol:disulfide interchange protein
MKPAYRPVVFVGIVFAVVAILVVTSKMIAPRELVVWRIDFDAAMADAQTTHKPVLAYFTADWCGPCQTLKHTIFADPDVDESLHAFYAVKIDIDENPKLRERFGIESLPQFLILDADGKIRKRTIGAMDTAAFLKFIELK